MMMAKRQKSKQGCSGLVKSLTSIHKQVLPQALAKAHALYAHITQDTFDWLRHFQDWAGVKQLFAPSRDLGNAFYFVHEIANQGQRH